MVVVGSNNFDNFIAGHRDIRTCWVIEKHMIKEDKLAIGIAMGMVAGVVIGAITGNIGLWISLGIAIGAAIGTILRKQQDKDENDEA